MARSSIGLLTGLLAMMLVGACASSRIAESDLGQTRATPLGNVLVDSKGMTLYTYGKDEPGLSRCHGMCAVFWPPAKASDGAKPNGPYSLIDRNGGKQWAYQDMPLYGYLRDDEPSDVKGDGVDGLWHVVVP